MGPCLAPSARCTRERRATVLGRVLAKRTHVAGTQQPEHRARSASPHSASSRLPPHTAKQDRPFGHAASEKAHYATISISSQLLNEFKYGCDACSQASTISIAPRRRFPSPGAARPAIPAQQRLGRRPWLHEAVERRRLEAVALAAGQVARRHQRSGRGCRRDGEQRNDRDAMAQGHWSAPHAAWMAVDGPIIRRQRSACKFCQPFARTVVP
jgi:hypothetical protein